MNPLLANRSLHHSPVTIMPGAECLPVIMFFHVVEFPFFKAIEMSIAVETAFRLVKLRVIAVHLELFATGYLAGAEMISRNILAKCILPWLCRDCDGEKCENNT